MSEKHIKTVALTPSIHTTNANYASSFDGPRAGRHRLEGMGMRRFIVSVGLPAAPADGGMEAFFDQVLEELEKLDVQDADYAGSFASGEIEIAVLVEADDLEDAHARAMPAVRTAIHAAEGSTPDWEPVKFSRRSLGAEVVDNADDRDLIEA